MLWIVTSRIIPFFPPEFLHQAITIMRPPRSNHHRLHHVTIFVLIINVQSEMLVQERYAPWPSNPKFSILSMCAYPQDVHHAHPLVAGRLGILVLLSPCLLSFLKKTFERRTLGPRGFIIALLRIINFIT